MFIFYEFRPFLYRKRARYLSKNTVVKMLHAIGITTYRVTNVTLTQGGGVITMGKMRNAYRILAYIV